MLIKKALYYRDTLGFVFLLVTGIILIVANFEAIKSVVSFYALASCILCVILMILVVIKAIMESRKGVA